jgi:RNA polymerase sigma-70 factor (ECF subfamily)
MRTKLSLNPVRVETMEMPGSPRSFPTRGPKRSSDAQTADSASGASRLPPLEPEATLDLLERVQHGDNEALEELYVRCLPSLRRWARGRLPLSARSMQDTVDLVQDTLLAALRQLKNFDARHQGALQAYLRQAVMNRIRDLVRQRDRRPLRAEMPEAVVDQAPSPLALAIGAENQALYEQALKRLRPADREAIVNRLELQHSYEELAVLLDKRSPDAARVAVMRAMKRLAEEMGASRGKRD